MIKGSAAQRGLLGLLSLAAMVALYGLVSNAYRVVESEPLARVLRPEVIPPIQDIGAAFAELVMGGRNRPQAEGHVHAGPHPHPSDHVQILLQQRVTLHASLGVTAGRVLFGLAAGVPLGVLLGAFMAWSRRADDYLHPLYVLLRSVPPLALITYAMLWFGHGEVHRLLPIVYAVATAMVIPAYHGVRDVASTHVVAARALGASGWLLLRRILLPAASPALLSGLRSALAVAWMTAVGAEMLMAENGMGNLLVGGGLWSSRTQTRSDPAVVIVGIVALAAAGWAMDLATRAIGARLTRWAR